jgi:hypothetical protein
MILIAKKRKTRAQSWDTQLEVTARVLQPYLQDGSLSAVQANPDSSVDCMTANTLTTCDYG